MLCISINQESRRMALVDMLNAARQCDLLEVRLDRFGKAPEIGEIMANKPKPVIMSCRRTQDGGFFDGTEDERQAILRQCIISKAEYVEIELDIADNIRRFPPAQRVICYTNLSETPPDIQDIYEEAKTKSPDVIKLTTLARTPEEAWPLVQILAKAVVPTVVVGLGKASIMLNLLGKKIGAPWTYAALERGMEAYPGQATVHDLKEVYRIGDIDRNTRFVAVTGLGETEYCTVAGLNAALADQQLPFRCLPLLVGNVKLFRKVMDAVKMGAAVIDVDNQRAIVEMGLELHGPAKQTQAADLLIRKGDAWHGFHNACPTWIHGLTEALRHKFNTENPIKDRIIGIVGLTAAARILAAEIQRLGGNAILASYQKKAGLQAAQELSCRFAQLEALYSTMHDGVIICDEEKDATPGGRQGGLHAGYLKAGMTVMDLTCGLRRSKFIMDAADRGCNVVEPRTMFLHLLGLHARGLTGKTVPSEVMAAALPEMEEEED